MSAHDRNFVFNYAPFTNKLSTNFSMPVDNSLKNSQNELATGFNELLKMKTESGWRILRRRLCASSGLGIWPVSIDWPR